MRRKPDAPVRRTYRFRLNGLVYLTVTAFLAVAAISSQNNLLFWCLGLAVGGIGVSGLVSGTGLMGVRAEREAIPDAAAGGPMVIRYKVRNTNWLSPAFGLTIYEREPSKRRVSVPWTRCLTKPVAFIPCVRPGQTVIAEARPLATARGRPEFSDFLIGSTFPFGLANKTLRFTQQRNALVYPEPANVRHGVLETLRAGGERGHALLTGGGDGTGDFYGIREYLPGDPMRSIVWRASARIGDLVTKQHARPAPKRLWVRLRLPDDTRGAEREGTISLAAGVLKVASERGFAVGLLCPELAIGARPTTGQQGLRNALGRLALIDSDEAVDAATAAMIPGRRDLVITVQPRADAGLRTTGKVLAFNEPAGWGEAGGPVRPPREPAA